MVRAKRERPRGQGQRRGRRLTREDPVPYRDSLPCIRCGYCDRVCPVRIYLSLILADGGMRQHSGG